MGTEPITVESGHVVMFNYTLTNDAGEVLDASNGNPLAYLHGSGNIVPGLEKELLGSSVGTKKKVTVAPEDAYGIAHEDAYQQVPRSEFPDGMDIQVGMPIQAQAGDGQMMLLWIFAVDGDSVTVTPNHPLAGQTLHFDVEIMGIREASDEEKSHGHVHGPGGHQH